MNEPTSFYCDNDVPLLMWTTDVTGRCDWLNRAWCDFTGSNGVSPTADGRVGFIHVEDRDMVMQASALAAAERDPIEMEYRIRTPAGTYRWILDRSVPRFDAEQEFLGYLGVGVDITNQVQYRSLLENRELELRQLHAISEREKGYLACAIHDGLLQDVIGAEMLVQSLPTLEPEKIVQRVELIRETLSSCILLGRRLIGELSPMTMEDAGLAHAIRFCALEIENRSTLKINVDTSEFAADATGTRWQANVFRVVQEALNNAESHSGSDRVDVRLACRGDMLRVEVQDYGAGFDVSARGDSFGLRMMRERAEVFGGEVSIESSPAGTTVTLAMPMQEQAA